MLDITFLISTYNRATVLLATLANIDQCGLQRDRYEIIVVDNASTDSTSALVLQQRPDVHLISLPTNRGPCAKNEGLRIAQGRFVVFLDDDSYPSAGSIERMIAHFDQNPFLGAATFTITLPGGRKECSAYPGVFIGCGTGFRRRALEQVGGLPEDFFMAAEEYDLSLRLLDGGWEVRSFTDLHATHLKTPGARYPKRIATLDMRNNLLLVARFFPSRWVLPYAMDWARRYRLIAAANGHRLAHWRGVLSGLWAIARGVRRAAVSEETFETFARVQETEDRLAEFVQRTGAKRVLFIDLGKNSLAYHRAAHRLGLTVIAITDANLGGHGFRYHGNDIVTDQTAMTMHFDAAIVSNLSPVHAEARGAHWRQLTRKPVIDLFESPAAVSPAVPLAA
jgi:GT2 family glycosyltransferase